MHPTTKTSKPAILTLAIGLTILTQVSAVGPSSSAATLTLCQPLQPSLPVTALQLPATVAGSGWTIGAPSAPASMHSAVCDECRTICARSCTTYACKLCIRSIKCGKLVPWCVSTKR